MAVSLTTDVREETAEVLRVIERATYKGTVLAVAEDGSGRLHLVRERERGIIGTDGKRSRDNGTERYWKRTSALADIAAAMNADLIAA